MPPWNLPKFVNAYQLFSHFIGLQICGVDVGSSYRIAGVVNNMKDLISYESKTRLGPIDKILESKKKHFLNKTAFVRICRVDAFSNFEWPITKHESYESIDI